MFEYVKAREAEAKRQMTVYGVLLAIAIVAILAVVGFSYGS
jgi:hypothetical protein